MLNKFYLWLYYYTVINFHDMLNKFYQVNNKGGKKCYDCALLCFLLILDKN